MFQLETVQMAHKKKVHNIVPDVTITRERQQWTINKKTV